MVIIRKLKELQLLRKAKKSGKTIGFVPTMGDLHAGHLSLIRKSKNENACTVVSIFVNPAQFNQKQDYLRYHRNGGSDLLKCKKEKVDFLFIPSEREIYPPEFQTSVRVEKLSQMLCGIHRPGHFQGVATIVLKLFNLVGPDHAYFGMKDYQQLLLIRQMTKDLHLPVRVISCATVREKDGLACSSRNRRLSIKERCRAAGIFAALKRTGKIIKSKSALTIQKAGQLFKNSLKLTDQDQLEYIEFVHPETLKPAKKLHSPLCMATAVWIGKTRLIDHIQI